MFFSVFLFVLIISGVCHSEDATQSPDAMAVMEDAQDSKTLVEVEKTDAILIPSENTVKTDSPEGQALLGVLQSAMKNEKVITAIAEIKGTAEDSTISGNVSFSQQEKGVLIQATVSNVTVGKHGFHVHENGSCDDSGKAAGGHFNPMKMDHGFLPKDGAEHSHSGDMGNIDVAEDGTGSLMLFLPGLSLTEGENNIANRAVILHEKEDDFGQPTGNAGGRIGCGIIKVNE